MLWAGELGYAEVRHASLRALLLFSRMLTYADVCCGRGNLGMLRCDTHLSSLKAFAAILTYADIR
jgi:hypothetical protein